MGNMKKLIIFVDCGDTIMDESTQVYDEAGEIVVRAEPIEGAVCTLKKLKEMGYPIVLMADGMVKAFQNMLIPLGLWDMFDARITSEEVGTVKPDAKMFEAGLSALHLTREDAGRVCMIGNNLKRDILGANRMGIQSVLFAFSPRYCMTPSCPEETPRYRFSRYSQLIPLMEEINNSLN